MPETKRQVPFLPGKLELKLANTWNASAGGAKQVQSFAEEHLLSPRMQYMLSLVFEEFATNVVKYAFDDKEEHFFTVSIEIEDQDVTFIITDDGHEFNPWNEAAPVMAESIEDASVGGIGIDFVRKAAKRMDYKRENGCNIVTVVL